MDGTLRSRLEAKPSSGKHGHYGAVITAKLSYTSQGQGLSRRRNRLYKRLIARQRLGKKKKKRENKQPPAISNFFFHAQQQHGIASRFRALGLVSGALSCGLPVFRTPCTTDRGKWLVFNWSLFLVISLVELRSARSPADSALITGCEPQSLLSAMQLHKSMGKATFPTPKTSPVEHCKPTSRVPIPWKDSGDGERLEGTAGHPPGYSLAEGLVHFQFISGIPIGFPAVMILARRLHTLLLIRILGCHRSLGTHLRTASYLPGSRKKSRCR